MRLACLAERTGWDGFFLWDHILFSRNPPVDVVDPWTTLAAIAASTERLVLGTLITPLARYEPWKLARILTTVDHLSAGRVIVGVGLGSPDDDFVSFWHGDGPDELGSRRSRYLEGLALLPRLLARETVTHDGTNHTLRDVTLLPGGYRGRKIPIWIGGSHDNRYALARARRHDGAVPLAWGDDGWPRPLSSDEVDEYARELGHGFALAYWNQTEVDPLTRERAAEIESAGATWWIETTKHGRPRPSREDSLALIDERITSLRETVP